MSTFVKCQNPNCINTIERIRKGGHWKKFCNSKCRSQYHSNTSSKYATPYMLGQSVTESIGNSVAGQVNSAVTQMSGNIIDRMINQLTGKLNQVGLPVPIYTVGGVILSQFMANLFKVEDKDTRRSMAVWFGGTGAAVDFFLKEDPPTNLNQSQVLPVAQNAALEIAKKAKSGSYISASDYKKISIPTIPMNAQYDYLFGMPARDFYMVLHGLPGNGKTSFAVKFAEYFNKAHGRVLYLASEQSGVDLAFQEILKQYGATFKIHTKPRDLSQQDLLAAFKSYDLIILDSATDLGLYPNEVKTLQEQSGKALISILQSTKDGGFKGSQEWLHDVDISVRIDDFKAILQKSRYKTASKKIPTKGTTIPI